MKYAFCIIKKIIKARKENWDIYKTLYLYICARKFNKNLKFGQLVIYKNVKVTLNKPFIIKGNGTLKLGYDLGSFPRGSHSAFRLGSNSEVILNGNFIFLSGHQININNNAIFEVGSGYMNHDSNISCKKRIKIGNNVIIAEKVCIMDNDGHNITGQDNAQDIIFEDNSWIGFQSIILKGVKIAHGSIVGAGSIVTANTNKNCIVAGNPARVIRENIKWEN